MSEINGMTELHRIFRPKTFKEMIGQPEAVSLLRSYARENKWPHAIMLCGPSGVGKTSLARIIASKLGCNGSDYREINAASSRGIDTIREVEERVGMAPMMGKCRIFYFDEAHHLVKRAGGDAQTALLKVLEDVPPHVYFILATTNHNEMLGTILTRCTKIFLKPLSDADIAALLKSISAKAGFQLSEALQGKIVDVAGGSAREALNRLNQVMSLTTEEERLGAIVSDEVKQDAFDIVKLLMWDKMSTQKWPKMADLLGKINEQNQEPEGIRKLVMANARSQLLKNNNPAWAALIIEIFQKPFYTDGEALLAYCCYEVLRLRK